MHKVDMILLVLIGVLIGCAFVGGLMYVKYDMGMNQMNEEFENLLSEVECENLYTYLQIYPDAEFVKNYFIDNCIWQEETFDISAF